ncbi:hypothetical protein [Plantactinospora endophytica]|uniref:hypothetical protein n=1 Tax=Plantactinospora endophytica TaxID=673535 RepID=UPI0019418CDE|nr:hypothetical protein [Plantactinospora endophytica]
MTGLRWRVLRDDGPDVVVAFDFANGRKEAGFADLAELLPGGRTLLEFEFGGGDVRDRPLDPTALCRMVLDDLLTDGRRLTATLGYCAGAGLACLLATLAKDTAAHDCRVVLFDPLVLGSGAVVRNYETGVEGLRPAVDESDYRAALAVGRRVVSSAERAYRLPEMIDELTSGYARLVRRSGERAGLPEEFRDQMVEVEAELVSHFASFLAYLATATAVDFGRSWHTDLPSPPVVFASEEHDMPAEFAPLLRRSFDVPRASLLSDSRVAAMVDELLGQRPGPEGTPPE